jgi:hypothetical protein
MGASLNSELAASYGQAAADAARAGHAAIAYTYARLAAHFGRLRLDNR